MRPKLLGMTPVQLKEAALSVGLPAFTGGQLARWLYTRRARSFAEMTDISKAGREKLAAAFDLVSRSPVPAQRGWTPTWRAALPNWKRARWRP